jgi:hypothetical protein
MDLDIQWGRDSFNLNFLSGEVRKFLKKMGNPRKKSKNS